MKKILITGENSYIGTKFEKWLLKNSEDYLVDTISVRGDTWKNQDFSMYDIIYHVAGIAHIKETKKNAELYYKVNRDLTYKIARKAKSEGVRHFIFLSSMSVYGIEQGVITKKTIPKPKTNYGISKLEAEKLISNIESDDFIISIIRPPMVYGESCKGNYEKLSTLAMKSFFFPKITNQRSMIYIDNLSNYVKFIIDNERKGIFYPQNEEYVCTSDMVNRIANIHGKKIHLTKVFNPLLNSMNINIVQKVFGDLVYEKDESLKDIVNYKHSIIKSEKRKKILILANIDVSIYNTRRELVQLLLDEGYEVYISCLYGERVEKLKFMGCKYIETNFSRHGTNPFDEFKLLLFYRKIMKDISPNVVLTYSIKQNIYGGMAANSLKIPFLANITGLGPALEQDNIIKKLTLLMYKISFKKVSCVFFQNIHNLNFFKENGVLINKQKLIPGSGVNLDEYKVLDYPEDSIVRFLYLSRIVKEKGIDQYLDAAAIIRKKYPSTEFHVCGFCEDSYKDKMNKLIEDNNIIYHGMISDTKKILEIIHCTIHPSFYPEGMSNVLLESCASGRPIITTKNVGCEEIVEHGINGYLINIKSTSELVSAIENFLNLEFDVKKNMGIKGREKVVNEFDRKIVIDNYIEEIKLLQDRTHF